jgi:tetratricopeptide (TPR) repeat protein
MRPATLILAAALAAAPAARAEIRSADECAAAVAANPSAAREEAAVWFRMGGGVPARLCEASALAAMGAHGTAAELLTAVATNPNRAIPADARAVILADGARLWLAADRPDLARASLTDADKLTPADGDRRLLLARAAAAEADWPAARAALEAEVAASPNDALAHALLAAALRNQGDAPAALAEAQRALALSPDLPEALFEAGAASAETGDKPAAAKAWLRLLETAPTSDLAPLARANLQRLD